MENYFVVLIKYQIEVHVLAEFFFSQKIYRIIIF